MPLPEKMADLVSSESVMQCPSDTCSGCKVSLCEGDIEYLVRNVPKATERGKFWERDKVVRNLRRDLQELKPRAWSLSIIVQLAGLIRTHDWY